MRLAHKLRPCFDAAWAATALGAKISDGGSTSRLAAAPTASTVTGNLSKRLSGYGTHSNTTAVPFQAWPLISEGHDSLPLWWVLQLLGSGNQVVSGAKQ